MIPARTERLPWREIDGQAVVVQPQSGAVHEFNAVGTYLWNHADGKKTVAELARLVAEAFDVNLEAASADALEFFRRLEQQGLVRDGAPADH